MPNDDFRMHLLVVFSGRSKLITIDKRVLFASFKFEEENEGEMGFWVDYFLWKFESEIDHEQSLKVYDIFLSETGDIRGFISLTDMTFDFQTVSPDFGAGAGQLLQQEEDFIILPIEIYFERKMYVNNDLQYFRIDRSKMLVEWYYTEKKGDRVGLSIN